MSGRFEIREITRYIDLIAGWCEVVITDHVTGHQVKARARNYTEAEREAWSKLKAVDEETADARSDQSHMPEINAH